MAVLIYQVCSFFLLCFLCNFLVNSHHLCDPKESLALLEFKKGFSLNESSSSSCSKLWGQTFYPKTATWKESTDCCSWDGVECDEEGEGHVIGLDISCSWLTGTLHPNSTLFTLSHLQSLNLSSNSFNLSPLSPQFGTFQKLRVLDLSSSSFKGDVPIEISHFSKLVSLDLSSNYLKFSNFVMNQLVHNLTNLRNFAVAGVDLSGITPTSFTNLSLSLASLRLSLCGLSGNFPAHIMSLPSLRVLQLDANNELKGHLPITNWSKSLEILDLGSTNFSREIPNSIGNAKLLRYLDLGFCKFTGGIPKSIGNLTQLNSIVLSGNKLNGQLPDTWNNLQKLTNFVIDSNSFEGQLPNSVFHLTQLSNLAASSNFLSGSLPANVSLKNLIDLRLEDNLFISVIPCWIYELPRLNYLDLSRNNFNVSMGDFISNSLEFLGLSGNNLQGEISESIYTQPNLTTLLLGSNNLSGVLNLNMMLRIKSLTWLEISNNNQLSVHYTNVSFGSNLVRIDMGSLKLEKFPYFLRHQKNLNHLNLSDNQIQGEIPKWFTELSVLITLDLSHNFLSSGIELLITLNNLGQLILDFNLFNKLPILMLSPLLYGFSASNNQLSGNIHPSICQATNLNFLDLSNNSLSGEIPSCMFNLNALQFLELKRNNFSGAILIPPPVIIVYTASENQLTGEIPPSICHATYITILTLSNNHLSGTIPPCLTNMTYLSALDLKSNNFSGTIPTIFSRGSQLRSLDLNNNQMEGELPPSLLNCENLQVLNIGNNKITGYFPHWLQSASSLQVLILRSNRFYGHINNSMTRHSFPNLRIIDLSRNYFSGPLPSNLFKNLIAMKQVEARNQKLHPSFESAIRPFYQDTVVVSLKGLELKLERILLIFKAIDLSSNNFSGEVPKSIGMLISLKGLILSHNKLTGRIPTSFGNLNNLEWLDLSSNRLSGNIPPQLAVLTFLSFLNLSQNQLSGPIPQGKQFATFENSSYIGNLGLCGFPLPKCDAEKDPKPQLQHDEEDDIFGKGFWWKVVFMGYGCGMVFGIFVGYILFRIGKPQWIVAMVEGKRSSQRQMAKRRNCWPKKRTD
ncbi:receptor-like protein 12 [Momordica charantia]|uniref:Receptor-like protein 12 n=1 Tax=Momordica charantia TaxID=3673 RepID=A0A6J1CV29_MOMCH|nr:receptor-like protein 12 [Momordica charantia]